jgi:hypothetical protein
LLPPIVPLSSIVNSVLVVCSSVVVSSGLQQAQDL